MERIKITFYPDVDKKDLETGVCSFAGWQHKEMMAAMEMLFVINPNERLCGITIGEDGIRAKIENVK